MEGVILTGVLQLYLKEKYKNMNLMSKNREKSHCCFINQESLICE